MLGPLIAVMLAMYLWPVLVMSMALGFFVWSVILNLPRIFSGDTPLRVGLAAALILQGLSSWLIMQSPTADLNRSLAIAPTTTIGLLICGWTLLGWVVAISLAARLEYQRMEAGENLDAHLHEPWLKVG